MIFGILVYQHVQSKKPQLLGQIVIRLQAIQTVIIFLTIDKHAHIMYLISVLVIWTAHVAAVPLKVAYNVQVSLGWFIGLQQVVLLQVKIW